MRNDFLGKIDDFHLSEREARSIMSLAVRPKLVRPKMQTFTSGAILAASVNWPLNGNITCTTEIIAVNVANNNRPAIGHIWYYLPGTAPTARPFPEGNIARLANSYSNAMQYIYEPIILTSGDRLQIRDNAYQIGDTTYYTIFYYEYEDG